MPLAFPTSSRAWDATAKAVTFTADDGGRPVKCSIAADALHEHFGMAAETELDALRAFDRCRMVIESAASKKYDRWRLNGGDVSLRSRDFGRAGL
jgi:hypothetical protein